MNYASFEKNNLSENNKIIFNYKNKFSIKNNPSEDIPGFSKMTKNKLESVGIESKLQLNKYKDNKDLNRVDFYYTNSAVGPGHGFGNLEISNDIRNGNSSRNDTKEFKEIRESNQLFDYQFQYLDRNFQDPNHIVMPIPRGGNTTREKTQLFVNINSDPNLSKIDFSY
jgi:hypothetical protein